MVKDGGEVARIAKLSGQSPKRVADVLEALRKIAAKTLQEHKVFKLQKFVKFTCKSKPERPRTTKNICGRNVVLPYLPPRVEVKCFAAPSLLQGASLSTI